MASATLTKPNIAVGAGAGGGASASIATGSTSLSGTVTVTTAGTPAAGTLATISFTTLGGSDPDATVASPLTGWCRAAARVQSQSKHRPGGTVLDLMHVGPVSALVRERGLRVGHAVRLMQNTGDRT